MLCALLLCMPHISLAQTNLQAELENAESLRTKDPEKTKQILQQIEPQLATLTAEQTEYFYFLKAYSSAFHGDLDLAIALTEKSKNSSSIEIRVKSNLLLSNVYEAGKNYSRAYTSLYDALKDANGLSSSELLANIYTVAAQLHISAGAYEKAYEFAEPWSRTPRRSDIYVSVSHNNCMR